MFDIVTVGSAVSDIFVQAAPGTSRFEKHTDHEDVCYHIGSKILVQDVQVETGGGGTNTAVAFARLGFKTGFIGKIGDDSGSQSLLEDLKKEGVTFLGKQTRGKMGLSIVLTGLHHDRTILTYKGVNNFLETKELKMEARKTKRYYFSSMLGTSWETIRGLAAFATREHIPYTFNPSLYLAKKGRFALRSLLSGCELLTLNKEEAYAMTGSPPSMPITTVLLRLQQYVPLIAITDGKNGITAFDGTYRYTIPGRPIKVVDSTGAGDAFAAGVTAGLAWRMSFDECLKIGMLEAESVLTMLGAKNLLLTKKELMKRLHTKESPKVFRDRL